MSVINTWTDISCPSSCGVDLNLPAISVDQDCTLVPNLSQVSDLFITPDGAADAFSYPSADGDPTSVTSALDNTDTTNSYTKQLVGKGGVAEPEEDIYEGAKLTRVISKRRYRLEFEVNVKEKATRNLLRNLQCNWKSFIFRYGTLGGYVFGGSAGIQPSFVNAVLPLDAADDGRELGRIILEFETYNGDPPRHVNPFAS